jgi:Reverse transcriptase-like
VNHSAPQPGRYHLETDASLKPWERRLDPETARPTYLAGGGVVLRDPDMRPLEQHSVALGYLSTIWEAECAALLWGLRRALELKIGHLRVRNDDLSLIRRLDGSHPRETRISAEIVSKIIETSREFVSVEYRWNRSVHVIERGDGAHSADYLARRACGLGLRSR